MQSMYDKVVACIKKPPILRTDEEAENLVAWFSKKSQLFESMKTEVIKDIIKNCDFSERYRDDVIIRQGDKGNKFYIILSGKVSIFINTDAVPDNPEDAQQIVTEDVNKEGEKKELDRTKYGKYIAPMLAGKSFGELALINKDCVRNASIIADELTHLVEVGRDLYNRSLRSAQEADFRQRIDFVNGSVLFQRWMARYKRQAAMSLQKEHMLFDMPIVTQGEPVNGLVFILKGQAKIVIDILQHHVQYPHLQLKEDPLEVDRREIIGKIMEQNKSNNKSSSAAENKNDNKQKLWEKPLRRQGGYSAAEQRQAQRHLEIALVGPGELIGDIEHGMELSTYAQSVICTQNTEFYLLDAKNFERLVLHKRNIRTMKLLREKAEIKLLSRVARSLDKQVPLIRHLVHRIEEDHRKEEGFAKKRNQPKVQITRNVADTSSFIPKPGALIDMYGPGTVFYYNRLKRTKKALRAAKQLELMQQKGGRLRHQDNMLFEENSLETNVIRLIDERDLDEDYATHRDASLEFFDWETSSQHLEVLEKRLRNWYDDTKDLNLSTKPVKISRQTIRGPRVDRLIKLPRFKKEENNNIHSGTKIYLRPRQPVNREQTRTFNFPSIMNEQEQIPQASEIDTEKTSKEIFLTARSASLLNESLEVDGISKCEKVSVDSFVKNRNEDEYRPEKATDSTSPVHFSLQKSDDDRGLSTIEDTTTTEGERIGEVSYLSHLTSLNNFETDSNPRLPYIHIQNRDGSLPPDIHHKTVSRLSNLLPTEAVGDPVGFAVAQSTLENATFETSRRMAEHGPVRRHRQQTLLILKDILDYHLVPIEIGAAIKNSQLKNKSSDLLSSNHVKNASLSTTSSFETSDDNPVFDNQSRFRLRMRSVLLPSRLQSLPVLLSEDSLKLSNKQSHS